MCLDLKSPRRATIAKKDIVCYKYFRVIKKNGKDVLESPFRNHIWSKRTEIAKGFNKTKIFNFAVNIGLHAYTKLKDIELNKSYSSIVLKNDYT